MNKFIKSDIESGYTLLGTGLGHIIVALITGETEKYELETPLSIQVVASILESFDHNIKINSNSKDKVTLDVGNEIVYINKTPEGCHFYI